MADVSVQRGVTTISAGSTTATITEGTDYNDPANGFIRIVSSHLCGTLDGGGTLNSLAKTSAYITNPTNLGTSITFQRETSDATYDMRISWEIMDFPTTGDNAAQVRQVEAIAFGNSDSASGSTVSGVVTDADVCVFITSQANESAFQSAGSNLLSTASWNSGSQQADFSRVRTVTDANNVSYAVVEFTGAHWSVERVSHTYTLAGSAETETITDVGSTGRAFLHAQSRGAGGAACEDSPHQVWLSGTDEVSFQLDSGAGSPGTSTSVAWVVSNSQTDGTPMDVQHISGTHGAAGTFNIGITAIAATADAAIMGECATLNQNTNSWPRQTGDFRITSTTNVEGFRADGIATWSYRFSVVEWPTDVVAGGATEFPFRRYYQAGVL